MFALMPGCGGLFVGYIIAHFHKIPGTGGSLNLPNIAARYHFNIQPAPKCYSIGHVLSVKAKAKH